MACCSLSTAQPFFQFSVCQQAQLGQVGFRESRSTNTFEFPPLRLLIHFSSISFFFHSFSTFINSSHVLFSIPTKPNPTHSYMPITVENMPVALKHDFNMATTTTTAPVPTITCTKEENILHQAWHSLEEALHLREPMPPSGNIQSLPQNKVFAN